MDETRIGHGGATKMQGAILTPHAEVPENKKAAEAAFLVT
jgi:hypothetical protein